MSAHDHGEAEMYGLEVPYSCNDHSTVRTDQAAQSRGRQWLRSGYDLLVEGPRSTPSRRVPLCYSHMTIGNSEGPKDNDIVLDIPEMANRQAILKLIQANLFFNNLNPRFEILVNGTASAFCQLQDGDRLTVGEYTITVLKLSKAVAFLEGYTDPHRRQHWTLSEPRIRIGRPGKRDNQVELNDPTVSREHATILLTDGHFILHPDSTHQVWVNTEPVKGMQVLNDEDLIQIGQQLMRFRSYSAQSRPRALLPSEATILFSDIWNYTSMAESRPLEESIGQLNEVYKKLGRVILDHQGLLMTYLGDAMMAVFGAEEDASASDSHIHAELAVRSGLAMLEALEALNEDWRRRNMPQLEIGIGIATGEVMMGDVGVTGHREFAAMGDTTNVASRIEKMTRENGIHLLINEETARLVRNVFALVELGSVEVRGRRKPVNLYQVLGEKSK
jgi:class 3 adenylate cyclase